MAKTITEINEKIRQGQAVVVTAEEIIDIVREKGAKQASQEFDGVDYSDAYPHQKTAITGEVSCADLKSGKITIHAKEVPTASKPLKERPIEE